MVNIALFLATEKGYSSLSYLIKNGYSEYIKCVFSFKENNVERSYDELIEELCYLNNIDYYLWKNVRNNLIEILKNKNIDACFTIAWRFLIPSNINDVSKHGLIVFHDSLLPKYRGFSPTPTAIICGETKIGITALKAVDEVDEGDIILQKEMLISEDEYIDDIIKRQCEICERMLVEIIDRIEKNCLTFTKQNHFEATYSIWRNIEDCKIDWTLNARQIYNLIRAVNTPYPGAFCYYKGKKIIIRKAKIADDLVFMLRQPGKIWSINQNIPKVICGVGMIQIIEANFEDGSKVIFDKVRQNLN